MGDDEYVDDSANAEGGGEGGYSGETSDGAGYTGYSSGGDSGYTPDDSGTGGGGGTGGYDGGGGTGGYDGGGGAEGAGGGSGGEAAVTEVRTSTKTWGDHFADCMGTMGVPAPTSFFTSATAVTATVAAIEKAVTTFGTEVTIGELIGAGLLSEVLLAAGAVTASAYAGICVGCLGTASLESITD
jgi:hypothetical protein